MQSRTWALAFLSLTATQARANVIGSDNQNFNPVAGTTSFVTVHSSDTLAPGRFSLGLFTNQAVNSLPYKNEELQSRGKANDTLTGLDAGVAVGVLKGFELGITAPFVVAQSVDEDDTRGEFEQRGNTELRGFAKYAFLKRKGFGLAAIASVNVNRTAENPTTGAGTGRVTNLELAGDATLGKVTLGMNLGYRMREAGEPIDGALVEPLGNQALASAALAWRFVPRTALVVEAFGAKALQDSANETDRSLASAESLFGLRHDFMAGLTGHVGAGTELMHGLSTPDWRLYAGLVTETGFSGARGKTVAKKAKKKKQKPVEDTQTAEEAKLEAEQDTYVTPVHEIPTEAPDEVFVLRNINFEFDSDFRVLPGAVAEIDKLAAHLEKTGFTKLVIEGHTDFMGTDEYNDDLSTRRARTVRRALIKRHGLSEDGLMIMGYGERVPMTSDTSDEGRQINRRVEIKIYRD